MKIKFLLLFVFLTCVCLSNDIFIYKNEKNVVGENIINNEISELKLTENSTHSLTNNLSIVTLDDQSMMYALSSKTFIKQDPNTSVYFNEFFIEFENDFESPENLIVKNANANFSVSEGQVYLIQRAENVNTSIMTSLANISIGEAKIFIKTGPTFTSVYVFDGVAYVYENKGNKMFQVAKGTSVVVVPSPNNWGPRSTIGNNHTFVEKSLDDLNIGNQEVVDELFKDLQYSFDNTIFINYDKEIFGIKYKKRETNK